MADPLGFLNGVVNNATNGRVDISRGTVTIPGVGTIGGRQFGNLNELIAAEGERQRGNPNDSLSNNEFDLLRTNAASERRTIGFLPQVDGRYQITLNGSNAGDPLRLSDEVKTRVGVSQPTPAQIDPTVAFFRSEAVRQATDPNEAVTMQDLSNFSTLASTSGTGRANLTLNRVGDNLIDVHVNGTYIAPLRFSPEAMSILPPVPAPAPVAAPVVVAQQPVPTPQPVVATQQPVAEQGYTAEQRAAMDAVVDQALSAAPNPVAAPSQPAVPAASVNDPYSQDQLFAIGGALSSQQRAGGRDTDQIRAVEQFLYGDDASKKNGQLSENEVTAALNRMQSRNYGTPEERGQIAALGAALGVQGVTAPVVTEQSAALEPSTTPFAPELAGPPQRQV